MSYDDDIRDAGLCYAPGCSICAPEREVIANRWANREATDNRPPAPVVPSGDGVVYVPPVVDVDALLAAIGTGDGTVTLTREDAARVVTTLRERATLQADAAQSLRESFARARREHEADVTRIGDVLLEKAEEHGWCSEYERTVEELNDYLSFPLPVRNRTHVLYLTSEDGETLYSLTVETDSSDSSEADAARYVIDSVRYEPWLTSYDR